MSDPNVDAILQAFDQAAVRHPLYDRAMEDLDKFYRASHPLGFLAGPPLVGKSRLARAFADKANESSADEVPVLYAEATGLCGNTLHVYRFLKPFAVAAKAAGINHIVGPPQQQKDLFGVVRLVPAPKNGSLLQRAEIMGQALRHAVEYRHVRLLVVDNIGAILPGKNPEHIQQRMQCLEIIAQETNVRMLLVGRDKHISDISCALNRIPRLDVIRLPRYTDPGDRMVYPGFWNFANELVKTVPKVTMPLIEPDDMVELHSKCLGCPGWLVQLFREALLQILTPGLFQSSELHVDQIVRMGETSTWLLRHLREIKREEWRIVPYLDTGREEKRDVDALKNELNLTKRDSPPKPDRRPGMAARAGSSGNGLRRRRVGERNPGRLSGA